MVSDSSDADAADATYDTVYRATRDAIWDVVGTATLILFYLALAGLCFAIASAGISPLLTDSEPAPASVTAAGIGAVGFAVGLFAIYRIHALSTE